MMQFGQEGVLSLLLSASRALYILTTYVTVTVSCTVSCRPGISMPSHTCIPVECLCECEGILGISGGFEIAALPCVRFPFAFS